VSEQMGRQERDQEETENKNGGEEPRLLRLTRDKELLAHVSLARYLTGEQIRRLIFSGGGARFSRRKQTPEKNRRQSFVGAV